MGDCAYHTATFNDRNRWVYDGYSSCRMLLHACILCPTVLYDPLHITGPQSSQSTSIDPALLKIGVFGAIAAVSFEKNTYIARRNFALAGEYTGGRDAPVHILHVNTFVVSYLSRCTSCVGSWPWCGWAQASRQDRILRFNLVSDALWRRRVLWLWRRFSTGRSRC